MSDSEPCSSDSGSSPEVDNKCRICITESGEQDVCEPWPSPWKGMGPTIACDIYKLTKIIIFKHNRYKFICDDCCNTLKHVCKFVNTIRLSNFILNNSYRKHFQKKKNINSSENESQNIMEVLSPDEDNMQRAEIMDQESSQDGDGEDDESDEFEDDLIKAYYEITKQDNRHLGMEVDPNIQPEQNKCTQEKTAEQKKEQQGEQIEKKDEKQEQETEEIDGYLNKQPDQNMCPQKQLEEQIMCIPKQQPEQNICIPKQQPDENNMCLPGLQAEHNMCIPEPHPDQHTMCIPDQQAEPSMCTQELQVEENRCTQVQQAQQNMCIPKQQLQLNMCIQEPHLEQNVSPQNQQPENVSTEGQIQLKQEREEPPQDLNQITKEWPQPIQLDKSVSNIIFDSTIEIKQEVLSEDEYDMPVEESDHLVAVKSEPSDYLEGNIQIVSCNGSVPFSSPEKICDRDDFMREVGLERVIKMEPISQEMSYFEEEYLDSSVKEEPWSEEEETDLSLDCQLCAKELSCLSGLRAHVIAQHSYKSVGVRKVESKQPKPTKFTCLICGKAFSTKTDQMVHSIGHAACVCFGCGRGFGSFSELAQHRPACRPPDPYSRPQFSKRINNNNCMKRTTNKDNVNKENIQKDKEMNENIKSEDGKQKNIKTYYNRKVETKIKTENEETTQNYNEEPENINNYDQKQISIKNSDEKQENTKKYVEIEINLKKDDDTEKIKRENEKDIIKNEDKERDTNKRDDINKEKLNTDIKINQGKKYDVHVEIVQDPSDDETQRKKRNKKRKSGEQIKPEREAKHPKTEPPSCPETCFYKCTQNFTTEESQAIRSQYSSLKGQAKWEFFLEHTVRKNTIKKSKNEDCRRRRHRFQFYFNKNNNRVRVCKKFFCDVLRIGSVTVSNLYSKFDNGRVTFNELNSKKLQILENPSLRLSCKNITQVERHIQSIVCSNDENSKGNLSVDEMYAIYAETTAKPVGIEIYKRVYEILLKTAIEKFQKDNTPKRRGRKSQLEVSKTDSDTTDSGNKDSVLVSDFLKVELNDGEVSVKEEVESLDEEETT